MKATVSALTLLALATAANAADIEAGKARSQAVCAACHGRRGERQRCDPQPGGAEAAYLEAQLKALKDGTRKNAVMNAIASQLSPDEIANVAAYFATQPGAAATAKSDFLPQPRQDERHVSRGLPEHVQQIPHDQFPGDEAGALLLRQRSCAARREGRQAAAERLGAVRRGLLGESSTPTGSPSPAPTASSSPDQLLFYTAMARDAGWGKDIPEMLRNEEWNYAVFTTAKQLRAGVNQAECLACHKPLDKVSYTFTLEQITAAAKAK